MVEVCLKAGKRLSWSSPWSLTHHQQGGSSHLWEQTRLLTSFNLSMAAPSSAPPLSVSYTPGCSNLLHKQPCTSYLVFPSLSCVRVPMISSLRIVPWGNGLWDSGHFCPHYSSLCVLLCWPVPAHSAPLWVYRAKKLCVLPASLAPLMCHGQARVLLLSFSLILSLPSSPPLSCAPTGVSSLYWMVQKQNHKPISVTLAMRLDGPNLSPSGAIGSTPVSLKRPLSSRLRELFVWWQLQLSSCSSCDSFKSTVSPLLYVLAWWRVQHTTGKRHHARRCL